MRTAIALAIVCWTCACNGDRRAPPPSIVRIGELLDRTGSIATPSWSDSIRLAVATMNEALIRNGHPAWRFEIVAANSRNAPEVARAAALDLVGRDGAKAIVTDSGQDDLAVNELFYDGVPEHQLRVPVVCIACTSHRIDAPDAVANDPVEQSALRNLEGWNFRTALPDRAEARALAQLALARRRGRGFKVVVYASGDPDGRSFSDALKQAIVEQGGAARVEQIFHDPAVDPVAYDWTADVARLLGEPGGPPDVVVAASFPKLLVGFLKAWVDSDTKVPILHADGFRSVRVLESLDVSIEGYEGVSQAVLGEGPSARTFARDLEALTAQPPALRDAAAYDAAMTLMLATLRAGHFAHLADLAQVSGAGIRDSMRALGDSRGEPVYAGVPGIGNAIRLIDAGKAIHYAGASGACDDDRTGAVSRYRVQGGRFVEVDKVAGALVSSR